MKRLLLIIAVLMLFIASCSSKEKLSVNDQNISDKPVLDNPVEPSTDLSDEVNSAPTNPNHPDLAIALGEEFILYRNQIAKLKGENFQVKLVEFFNSPCPKDAQCIWSGVGISFEYRSGNESLIGVDLSEAFGHKLTVLDTDYETYASVSIG